MIDPGRLAVTIGMVMLNKGFLCMIFINNVNVIIFHFDYLFRNYINLVKVCDYVLYLGYVNFLLNIMVIFNSPLTLNHIPNGLGRPTLIRAH
jgi:hypothetical protein